MISGFHADERRNVGALGRYLSNETAGPACPVCRTVECRDFFTHKGLDLYACEHCATVFLYPPPTDDEIADIYHDLYQGASIGYFAKAEKKLRRSGGRMRYLSRYVASGSFLDIGCNGGFMVEAAREYGFNAYGLDLDSVSILYARQHYPKNRYFHGTVEAFSADAPQFDLAYCSEVIEHVPDVQSFISSISRLVRPGGVLFITTPDISHWRRPRDLPSWDGFKPPKHCVYLNRGSLRLLMEGHGFRVIRCRLAFKPGIKMVCQRI